VAPPSLHVSGNRYAWAPGRAPADVPLAGMPEWLVTATRAQANGKAVATPAATWRELVRNGVGEGARNDAMARLAGHFLRRDVDALVVQEILSAWNIARCRPPLDEQEVEAIVERIAECELKRRGLAS
jgi:Primase C terminal 1 (PriCT-1)